MNGLKIQKRVRNRNRVRNKKRVRNERVRNPEATISNKVRAIEQIFELDPVN